MKTCKNLKLQIFEKQTNISISSYIGSIGLYLYTSVSIQLASNFRAKIPGHFCMHICMHIYVHNTLSKLAVRKWLLIGHPRTTYCNLTIYVIHAQGKCHIQAYIRTTNLVYNGYIIEKYFTITFNDDM